MTDEENRKIENLKQTLVRAKAYGVLDAIENLEKENNYLKKDKNYLIHETDKLKKDIDKLQNQIEKMKNCGNCLHYDDDICDRCNNQTEWEMKK